MRTETILPLEMRDVCLTLGGAALIHRVSFTLRAGPRTIILGPNGSGKSLLLRLCHGLLKPSAGTVLWHGGGGKTASQYQAMVFQRPVMLRRSVTANVAYALALHDAPKEKRGAVIAEALALTGLNAIADRPARVLSFGEQQKLALARAWVLRPQVLFLDEPTASLDPAATHAVEKIIEAIHARGCKIIMTTHDLGQAKRLADEVLFFNQGRLIEQTRADAFFEKPQSVPAQAFLRGELLWNETEKTVP
ncbi:MAG: ATP-binding cassette domain-containing protein [Rhodospirillales bacterium]